MMRSKLFYRALLHLLPAAARRRDGSALEEAFEACLERERDRLGARGFLYAWINVIADTLQAAVALRLDARRRGRIREFATHDETHGDSTMSLFWQDVRYSLRILTRAPMFSATVVATLALAIGATTAVFSVVNTVLLRSLPFAEPDRLVVVYEQIGNMSPGGFSPPDFKAMEQRAQSFSGMGAYGTLEYELSGVQQPERVTAARVSAALFGVLGVTPAVGQAFTPEDDEGLRPVVILSDGLWRRAFGADPGVLGKAVQLDRRTYTVVGVMPRSFVFPNRGATINNVPAALFVPMSFTPRELSGFGSMYNKSVIARLKPSVSIAQASAEVRTIVTGLVPSIYPAQLQEMKGVLSGSAASLRDETVANVKRILYILFAAVGVVLLIACADVANLMLTRGVARGREIAVRSALGAGRMQVVRQVLVESTLLAIVGGVLGVVLAVWATSMLQRFVPANIPRLHELSLDINVLAFALVTSVGTAMMCGLLPALELSRRPSSEALKDGSRASTPGTRQRRLFGVLVAGQFAFAVVLLVAGGLLVRSFVRLMAVNPGFRAEHVLRFDTSLPSSAYARGSDIRLFYEQLLERMDRLPGTVASAGSVFLPLATTERRAFTIEAQPPASSDVAHVVASDWVQGRYFETLGATLRRGRYLTAEDTAASERVVVINETMAKQFWPGLDPVGQRIAWGSPQNHAPWMRIIGIIADVKQGGLDTKTVAQTYLPWVQVVPDSATSAAVFVGLRSLKIIVRTDADPMTMASSVQAQVRSLDPSLPVPQVQTMDAFVRESAAPQRFNTVLLGGFAGVALLLAAIGIGGVLATTVSTRTQEIGLRMALGANRGHVVRMIVRQGLMLVLAGLAIGLPLSALATRSMSSLLFDTGVGDPLTFAGAIALLLFVAAIACYIPARRATRVDPLVALRWE